MKLRYEFCIHKQHALGVFPINLLSFRFLSLQNGIKIKWAYGQMKIFRVEQSQFRW